MVEPDPDNLTELLQKWSNGDIEALEHLTPLVYNELHRIAKRYMRRERPEHTLQTSALVNEAYLRLMNWKSAKWDGRLHFYGVSAQLMRRILVDFARRRPKMAGQPVKYVELEDALTLAERPDPDMVALDDALRRLAEFDERKARVVELKFFGGMNVEEIAKLMAVSEITIHREWQKAKAWLYLELEKL